MAIRVNLLESAILNTLRPCTYSGSGNFLGISGNGNFREFPGIPDPHLAFPDRILEILNILSAFP